MNPRRIFAQVGALDLRARIKRRIFERPDQSSLRVRIDAHIARQTPTRFVERPFDQVFNRRGFPIRMESVLNDVPRVIATERIVRDDHAIFRRRATPVPAGKTIFDRLGAGIRVHVRQALPFHVAGLLDFHFGAGDRSDRAPTMPPVAIQDKRFVFAERQRMNAHDTGNASRQRRGFFLETHRQNIVFPFHGALADDQRRTITSYVRAAVFRKGPSILFRPVHRHVHRTMRQWIGRTLTSGFRIKWRKYAPDEADDGQTVLSVIG